MRFFRIMSFFLLMAASLAFAEQPGQIAGGTLSGKIVIQDKTPMSNGMLLLFNRSLGPPPHPYNYWRVPDMIMATEENGAFSIELPEGTYYLMIAQKSQGSLTGEHISSRSEGLLAAENLCQVSLWGLNQQLFL